MHSRPYKTDLAVAAELLRLHATPMDVLAFRIYEWRTNDPDLAAAERNTKSRADTFLPAVVAAFEDEAWATEYKKAFGELDRAERDIWQEVTAENVRESWVRVVSLIWCALDDKNGGDYSRSDIADRYNVNPGTVTRYIAKTALMAEGGRLPAGLPAAIPLALDYESETAEAYYTPEERQYYIAARQRYEANEGEFDLGNPIIADIIHQLISNSYVMQTLNREISRGKQSTKPVLFKRLTELQDTNAKATKELIGLQKELGKLERNEESLGALKRQYVKAKEGRNLEAEVEMEEQLFEMAKKNSRYLGFVN